MFTPLYGLKIEDLRLKIYGPPVADRFLKEQINETSDIKHVNSHIAEISD
jgi:hypothetical protein